MPTKAITSTRTTPDISTSGPPRAGATSAPAPGPRGWADRWAAARPRCCSRSAGCFATGEPGRGDQRHLHREDAEFLTRNQALPAERIRAVETGGCPHAAIREDITTTCSRSRS